MAYSWLIWLHALAFEVSRAFSIPLEAEGRTDIHKQLLMPCHDLCLSDLPWPCQTETLSSTCMSGILDPTSVLQSIIKMGQNGFYTRCSFPLTSRISAQFGRPYFHSMAGHSAQCPGLSAQYQSCNFPLSAGDFRLIRSLTYSGEGTEKNVSYNFKVPFPKTITSKM